MSIKNFRRYQVSNLDFKFAAVQFSSFARMVFNFNDYQNGKATELLKAEPFMQDLTNTYRALNYTLIELFENQMAGASPDATRVLLIITDGDPSDRDTTIKIVEKYDEKHITRFVIGGSLVLGSVGSNDWRGSLYELESNNMESNGIHIEDPDMAHSSYMGYSVAAGEKDLVSLYFTGAPRFKHMGEVVVFRKSHDTWEVVRRVTGEQIGSYFGAALCLVDLKSDGNTDFLLVGAPLFHHPHEKREGQIYVYRLTTQLELESTLNVSVPSRGRFGTSISLLADLNGDGLRDVAVGAPLEDDNRGAVYIYHGNQHTGIRPTFSQRIPADPGLDQIRFFGLAVDGTIDLGEDGLADLVVGSRGAAIVFRSKPVVNVKAHLNFEPAQISTVNIHCPAIQGNFLPMVTLTVCFDLAEVTRGITGTTNMALNITYSLEVDPNQSRQTSRGFFKETLDRNLQFTVELMTKHCFIHSVNMPVCKCTC
ncbi:hypothetical protein NHX12_017659 [Muraenolepis orangiensis]|uniref:VWFA domain-containing protein n=1 Tax=Muraenolepis orangiensis TaxID=630683 RepID=A0A9Q0IUS0_9TELE|nr:hypothetical protein NHX12_017659 [Muraenolepis orangiensis]